MKRSPIIAGIMGLSIFIAALLIAKGVVYFIPNPIIWLEQVLLKAAMILLSLGAIKYGLNISWADAGFRKPAIKAKRAKVIFSGMALGAMATVLIFFSPAKGIAWIKELNLLAFLLIVVIWSSLAEEILIRGFLQSYLQAFERDKVKLFNWSFSIPVMTCALVFAGMHLSLLFIDVDYYTVLFTVLATFLLGLLAGEYREKYQSIRPAIITHMSFNVGGIITGIIIAISYKLLTGEFPPH